MSIVRDNLMTRPGYTPYCGNDVSCAYRNPRTFFKRGQFNCLCGWQSSFEPEFIAAYRAKWAEPKPTIAEERAFLAREYRQAGEKFE
jgi:hypothetical protein